MPLNLSIKSVPAPLVEKLRRRAQRHHRSLQGELMTILEESLEKPRLLSPREAFGRLHEIGLKTRSDSTVIIRAARNRR